MSTLLDLAARCERCNDSGTIARSIYFPCEYRAPGPVPDYARGVYEATCDECDGSARAAQAGEG